MQHHALFDGTYSDVADGYVLGWLANLARRERLCEARDLVWPGHGPAGCPDSLLSAQRA